MKIDAFGLQGSDRSAGQPRWCHMLPDDAGCCQEDPRCYEMLPDATSPDAARCCQMLPDAVCYVFQMLPDDPGV